MPRLGPGEFLAVGRVFAHGNLLRTEGGLNMCRNFEQELARFCKTDHALAVSSGTAALYCALQACEIGPGDKVLVPAYTWMASAGAVMLAGAEPILVEVDETLAMDPTDLANKVCDRCKAIIPVHMLNRPCDMDRILQIAKENDLIVIEDSCQAVGVRYQGTHCGTLGDIGTFSFNQHKNMTCGEGGAILTRDSRLISRAMNAHDMGISFRAAAKSPEDVFLGANFRISEIQGAILRVQLKKLRRRIKRMEQRTATLTEALEKNGYPVAPHNSPDDAASVVVTFDTEKEAESFSQRRGARRLFDNSKHIYTEWTPILNPAMAHPSLVRTEWLENDAWPRLDSCARTLDILKRSCTVSTLPDLPSPAFGLLVRRLTS